MELSIDPETAERIALGVLSFVALIASCRWRGTPEGQKKLRLNRNAVGLDRGEHRKASRAVASEKIDADRDGLFSR